MSIYIEEVLLGEWGWGEYGGGFIVEFRRIGGFFALFTQLLQA